MQEEKTFDVEKFLSEKTSQTVYNGLSPELKEVTRVLFVEKGMNGELSDVFKSGAPSTREFLSKKKVELDKEKKELEAVQEKNRKEAEEREKKLQEMNNKSVRVAHRNLLIKQLFGLETTGKKNDEVIQLIKTYHASQCKSILSPMLNSLDLSDERIEDKIIRCGISAVYRNIFATSSFVSNAEGRQVAIYARVLENEFKRKIFRYGINDSDEKIEETMAQKRNEIINFIANEEASRTGMPIEDLKFQAEGNLPHIIVDLTVAALG